MRRWSPVTGHESRSCRVLLLQEALPRLHPRERHRARRDTEAPILPGDAGIARVGEVARVGKVRAEVRPARVLARRGGEAYRFRDEDEVLEVEPVVPGQVEGQPAFGHAGRVEPRLQLVECARRACEARRIAHDADIVPHHVVEPLAYRLQITRRPAERRARGGKPALDGPFVRLVQGAAARYPARDGVARDTAE